MAGGWASALGAAILQGNRGYHDAVDQQRQLTQQKFENNRQIAEDKRAQSRLDQDQRMSALQEAILKKQMDDEPKVDARERLKMIFDQQGPELAMNNPQYLKDAAFLGAPIQTAPTPPRMQRIQAIEAGSPINRPMQPLPDTDALAAAQGVTPDTGAVLSPDQQLKIAERKFTQRQMSAKTNWLEQASQPVAGPSVAGAAPKEPPMYDPAEMQAWQRAQTLGIPVPPLHESAEHKLWLQNQELVAKANTPPPSAATQREREAYAKIRILVPQIKESLMHRVRDPNDPTGQTALNSFGGWVGLAGQRLKSGAKAAAYDAGFPLSTDDDKIQQLAGLMKVTGSVPFMNGSRGQYLFNEAAQHLLDRKATPESMMQRLSTLEEVYPEFDHALSVQHGMSSQPAAVAPGVAPAAAPVVAPTAPTSGLKAGDTVKFSDIVARTAGSGVDPNTLAAQLKNEGVTVVK